MMNSVLTQLVHLANPVAGLAVMCAVHAMLCRLNPQAPLLNSLVRAGSAGVLSLLLGGLLAGWCGGDWAASGLSVLLVDAPIYACLAYGYANFVNLGQSSVRVRIYRELLGRPDGIDGDELRAEYDEQGMLRARLERLVEAADLRLQAGRYRIGRRRLVTIGTVIFGLKKAVLGRRSEFAS
jgi:hypothetical protein